MIAGNVQPFVAVPLRYAPQSLGPHVVPYLALMPKSNEQIHHAIFVPPPQ
jgi:hypothetical protein